MGCANATTTTQCYSSRYFCSLQYLHLLSAQEAFQISIILKDSIVQVDVVSLTGEAAVQLKHEEPSNPSLQLFDMLHVIDSLHV